MVGLITGANRGLGYELVKKGLELGHEIFAGCRRVQELDDLKIKSDSCLFPLKMDITQEDIVKEAAKRIQEQKGKLDFIINCAGVLFESRMDKSDVIQDMDISMFRKTMDVNVVGTVIVMKYMAELIYASSTPCIINITSEAGNLSAGGYHYLAYSVSKYAQNMYSQKMKNYLDEEKKDHHIRVYMVHPGRMDTVMGKENAQIKPAESAEGIWNILRNGLGEDMAVPFVNYRGEPMSY